jgi:hypothetical protein
MRLATGALLAAALLGSGGPVAALAQTAQETQFELTIADQALEVPQYRAALTVEAGGPPPQATHVQVGVLLEATALRARLHNVYGEVRFRAALDALQRYRAPSGPASAPSQP